MSPSIPTITIATLCSAASAWMASCRCSPSCIALSVVDPVWCIDYWNEQFSSGVKVPLELRKGLRQAQVVG